MKITKLQTHTGEQIEGPILIKNNIYKDSRGFFQQLWNKKEFDNLIESNQTFVQDNHSFSIKGVLRGMHYQINPKAQAKLIRCTKGAIFDVIIDLRKNSKTFCKWAGVELNEKNFLQIWIPKGFAHGFLTISEKAEIEYKVTEYWSKDHERTISWKDNKLAIDWPTQNMNIILSDKDKNASFIDTLKEKEFF